MLYLNSFLFAGFVCMIGQIILDKSKLTPGHITSLFVIIGSFLDTFSIYDFIVKKVGGGALFPITSFGHLLMHGAITSYEKNGLIGLFMGMFDLTASGITSVLVFAFFLALIFKPKD